MESTRFIIRGVELELTGSLRQSAISKTAPLFRHGGHIDAIHIDLELDHARGAAERFVAKGHLEFDGTNLIASARSENAYKSIDLLVESFDALLRSRINRRTEQGQSNPPQPGELGLSQLQA